MKSLEGAETRGTGARPTPDARAVRARLLDGRDHYDALVAPIVLRAKVSVWIATANLKTMLVEADVGTRARARGRYVSFFERLAELAASGVEVRLLHAAPPSGPLAKDLAKLGARAKAVASRRCPRVHLKLIAVDGQHLYLGSANVTGAGLGAKGDGKRNFEMGIVTDDPGMLDAAQERFDRIWRGAECGTCALRATCPAPLDGPPPRGGRSDRSRSASAHGDAPRPPRRAAGPPRAAGRSKKPS